MYRIYFSATMQYVVSCLFNDTFNNSGYTDRGSKLDICGVKEEGAETDIPTVYSIIV